MLAVSRNQVLQETLVAIAAQLGKSPLRSRSLAEPCVGRNRLRFRQVIFGLVGCIFGIKIIHVTSQNIRPVVSFVTT